MTIDSRQSVSSLHKPISRPWDELRSWTPGHVSVVFIIHIFKCTYKCSKNHKFWPVVFKFGTDLPSFGPFRGPRELDNINPRFRGVSHKTFVFGAPWSILNKIPCTSPSVLKKVFTKMLAHFWFLSYSIEYLWKKLFWLILVCFSL